jgi:phosphoserine phosphatase
MTALHVFDMDGTLLLGSTAAIELSRELGSMAELHELEKQLTNREITIRDFARRVYDAWRGLTAERVRTAAERAPWIAGMAEVWADIRDRGEHSLVITMSPDFFARALLERGVDTVEASRFPAVPFEGDLDVAGILTPEDKVRITDETLRKFDLTRADCAAYGDSMSDAPLFSVLDVTVAVNADHHLEDLASLRYNGSDLRAPYRLVRDLLDKERGKSNGRVYNP